MIQQRFDVDGVDLDGTLRVLAMLAGDPTLRITRGGLDRATQTPDGPGTITARWEPNATTVEVVSHGPGAEWLTTQAPALLGLTDLGATDFAPVGGTIREIWRRHRGLRVPRTGTVWHDLCWLIVQQRVQRTEAGHQWRRLVHRYGSPAPGQPELLVPPSAERMAAVPAYDFHHVGIERRRADTLRAVARSTIDIHRLASRPPAEAVPLLLTIPGIGPWTTSTLSAVTWGHPDAVIVGDSGIPSLVAWVLAAQRRADDDRMQTLLDPFRPHRYRVIQLAFASGRRPPRRQPRSPRTDIRRR